MPSWQPNWNDVVFDHAAAEAAAGSLDRSAAALRSSYDGLHADHRSRSRDWRGGHAASFERDLGASTRLVTTDIDAVLWEAARIRNAASAARAEQWTRERQREQWHREAAAEEAARLAAIEAARVAAAQAAADAAAATDPGDGGGGGVV